MNSSGATPRQVYSINYNIGVILSDDESINEQLDYDIRQIVAFFREIYNMDISLDTESFDENLDEIT